MQRKAIGMRVNEETFNKKKIKNHERMLTWQQPSWPSSSLDFVEQIVVEFVLVVVLLRLLMAPYP